MGSKGVFIIVIAAAAIAAAALFFTGGEQPKFATQPARAVTTDRPAADSAMKPTAPAVSTPSRELAAAQPGTPLPAPAVDSGAGREAVLASLHDAAITYDAASLGVIEPHLSSSDPEVRAAAAESVVILGDAAGAAILRRAAQRARTPTEAADFRAKADYLELPSASLITKEDVAEMRERKAAGLPPRATRRERNVPIVRPKLPGAAAHPSPAKP